MIKKPKIIVVMPAYYAAKTLEMTFREIPKGLVTETILIDDGSKDDTVKIAKKLGLTVYKLPHNVGPGGNHKTCFWEALKRNPDVVVLLHPDYQYDGSRMKGLIDPILNGDYDIMFGSRIKNRRKALEGGMPKHKYFYNRLFTLFANILLGENLSEYMSGFRAYSRKTLETVPFQRFSDDFVQDMQFLLAAIFRNLSIGEVPIPTRYHEKASMISSWRGLKYGLESVYFVGLFLLAKAKVYKHAIYKD
jgi:glycosyltransferase involved in cell wall biosynthesis